MTNVGTPTALLLSVSTSAAASKRAAAAASSCEPSNSISRMR